MAKKKKTTGSKNGSARTATRPAARRKIGSKKKSIRKGTGRSGKKTAKTTARKVSRRAPETPASRKSRRKEGGGAAITRASLSELEAEILRRQDVLRDLYAQRDAIAADLARVERAISQLNGAKGLPPLRARRARNSMNLVQALQKTLKGKTLSVTDAAESVQKAGYKTTSPNFRTIVNQALISNPKLFKKIARGQYTAK